MFFSKTTNAVVTVLSPLFSMPHVFFLATNVGNQKISAALSSAISSPDHVPFYISTVQRPSIALVCGEPRTWTTLFWSYVRKSSGWPWWGRRNNISKVKSQLWFTLEYVKPYDKFCKTAQAGKPTIRKMICHFLQRIQNIYTDIAPKLIGNIARRNRLLFARWQVCFSKYWYKTYFAIETEGCFLISSHTSHEFSLRNQCSKEWKET